MKLKVKVDWTEAVEEDRALFSVGSREFESMLNQLRLYPLLGKPIDGEGLVREWITGNFVVRFAVASNFRKVMIFQIRPKSELEPQWRGKVSKMAGEVLYYLGKEGLKKWLGL